MTRREGVVGIKTYDTNMSHMTLFIILCDKKFGFDKRSIETCHVIWMDNLPSQTFKRDQHFGWNGWEWVRTAYSCAVVHVIANFKHSIRRDFYIKEARDRNNQHIWISNLAYCSYCDIWRALSLYWTILAGLVFPLCHQDPIYCRDSTANISLSSFNTTDHSIADFVEMDGLKLD